MDDLVIHHLNYAYWRTKVLKDVSLTLSEGEITYILGPNGAGKSTLVLCISGMASGYTGTIRIPAGSRMGVLFDNPYIYPSLTVQNNIQIFLRYNRMEYSGFHDMINQYLEVDELMGKAYNKLSRGQRQQAALFISMINDPHIILLDEPFSGLDPFYTENLIKLLIRLKVGSRIILINDHIVSNAMRLADKIAFLIRHEMLWTFRPEILNTGIYYSGQNLSGDNYQPGTFAESVQEYSYNNSAASIPVTDLTELYSLAVNHGRKDGI